METQITIGVVGYGQLGEYLVKSILEDDKLSKMFQIGFVWNRTIEKVQSDKRIKPEQVLKSLDDFESVKVDLVVEVSHPKIIAEYGERFLKHANLFVGSPTAFADPNVEKKLRAIATQGTHGLYIPSGAFWGASDIQVFRLAIFSSEENGFTRNHSLSYSYNEEAPSKYEIRTSIE